MATGMLQSVPRPGSVGQLSRSMNLPVIEHPMARLGDRSELQVRGESQQQGSLGLPGREKTFVALDSGRLHLGLDRANLPPLTERTHKRKSLTDYTPGSQTSRILQWPPDYLQKPGDRTKKAQQSHVQCPSDELEYMIQEKLTTSYHGLKHLFKGNDPSGQGHVSRLALLKILYTLVGYITHDQYNKLLKRLGLEDKTAVSFDDFISCFKENETVQKEWLSPVKRKTLQKTDQRQHPEEHLRWLDLITEPCQYITATYCFALLKDHARNRAFDISKLLPSACLVPEGCILPPQLREMASHLGYRLNNDEFYKLWERFDRKATGAIINTEFFKILGLDPTGKPKPQTPLKKVPRLYKVKVVGGKQQEQQENVPNEDEQQEEQEETKDLVDPDLQNLKAQVAKHKKMRPRLEKIVDCLHYRFEEPYNFLLMGLKCFDFLEDNFISRIDFKRVLDEFGFPVSSIDIEHFLSRCNIRSNRGQINYKEFLMKFWNRTEHGMVNRIVTNSFHIFGQDKLPSLGPGETLSVEELEAKMIDFMHKDFMALLGTFRKLDKYNIGVITQYEFKETIERLLGYQMSPAQWEELKEDAGLDPDGLVPFAKFMEKFSGRPGVWNRRLEGNIAVAQVPKVPTPPEVARIRDRLDVIKQQEQQVMEAKNDESGDGRALEELAEKMRELFRLRFHTVDKVYKSMDRRMTGRLSKMNFSDLMKQCNMELTAAEVDKLWATFMVSPDNMFSFTQLVRQFTTFMGAPPPIKNKLPLEDTKELVEEAKKVLKERRLEKQKTIVHEPPQREPTRLTTKERDYLLDKIKYGVVNNWERLKTILRHLDKSGFATVPVSDMKDIMVHLHFELTEEEMDKILCRFDNRQDGNFHYIDFLEMYTEQIRQLVMDNKPVGVSYDKVSYKLQQRQVTSSQSWSRVKSPTLAQAIQRMRVKLIRDWKNIRRAFKKMDSTNNGYLNVPDFKLVLKNCGITVSNDDLFHILSEFDTNMDGKISYEEFLYQLLNPM